MAYFLEERIPSCIRFDAVYEEDYAVDIVESGGSQDEKSSEYRRLNHPFPRRRFNVAYQVDRDELYHQILSLYHRAFGQLAGFRHKHMDDFTTATDGHSAPTAFDQNLLQVSAKVFQLRKQYGHEKTPLAISWPDRIIHKPVAGTVSVAVNGTASTAFTVDNTTGLITFTTAPAANASVTGGCQFDYPVRFASKLNVKANHLTSRAVEFELIELLNP